MSHKFDSLLEIIEMTGVSDTDLEEWYPISRKDFRAWLESKDENNVVGKMGLTSCCPIANAIKTKDGDYVRVRAGNTTTKDYSILPNPNWVEKFVRKIDNLADEERSITAKQALEVLEEVEIL